VARPKEHEKPEPKKNLTSFRLSSVDRRTRLRCLGKRGPEIGLLRNAFQGNKGLRDERKQEQDYKRIKTKEPIPPDGESEHEETREYRRYIDHHRGPTATVNKRSVHWGKRRCQKNTAKASGRAADGLLILIKRRRWRSKIWSKDDKVVRQWGRRLRQSSTEAACLKPRRHSLNKYPGHEKRIDNLPPKICTTEKIKLFSRQCKRAKRG